LIKKKTKDKFSLDELLVRIALKEKYLRIRRKIVEKVKEIIRDRFEVTPIVRVVSLERLIGEIFEKLKGARVKDLRK